MPASDIGIDLGTRNSQVYSTGRGLVVSEPSVVVYDKNSEKIKAIGEEARQMTGHVSSNMEVIRPIRQGVIVDYTVMEKMLKYFISKAMGRHAFRKPRISICIPSGTTEIERKAVEEATDFGVRVCGDSMEPLYLDGQIIWIHKQETLEEGEIGVFFLDGDAYVKKYHQSDSGIQLISLNKKYAPIQVTSGSTLKTFGKVVG